MRLTLGRLAPTNLIRFVAEAVLLFLVVWAPWPFASVEYAWESILIGGTTLIVLLWFLHAYFAGQLYFRPDAFGWLLLSLAAISAIQLIPLPESIIGTLSPKRVELYHQLVPAAIEQLPGEASSARSTAIPLSFDPFSTRVFLAQSLSLFLLYTVVRSWLSSRESLRRLAWAIALNGFLLAVLAITQFFYSPNNVVYWTIPTPGAVFGPFICKNHYTDYILFCLGLGVGLLMTRREPKSVKVKGVEYEIGTLAKLTDSPDLIVMGIGLALVVMSIPFSLSRGGLLATIVAAGSIAAIVYRARGTLSRGFAVGSLIVLAAILLGGWYGWGIVAERMNTLKTGTAADQREELWGNTAKLIPGFLAVGGGNGAFARFEALNRTEAHPENYEILNAHNEYLEAVLEGGLLRLAITLALAFLAIRYCLTAYGRLRERSSGPLVLGILFGVVGLVCHSVVDFGIHMPAVALLATVLVAYAADAATDPTYIPFKKKTIDGPPPDLKRKVIKGPALVGMGVILIAAAIWVLFDSTARGKAEELKIAARDAARAGGANEYKFRIDALTEAVRRTPSDGVAWSMLAQARFEAADDEMRLAAMALANPPTGFALPARAFISPGGAQVREGLIAARTARDRTPTLARPHLFFALYNGGFAVKEPPKIHLERAAICSPTDANIFVLRGNEAMASGNRAAALAFWQKAMTLNRFTVAGIIAEAAKSMTAEQILSQVLPPEPVAISTAVELLHPRWRDGTVPRMPYLEKIVSLDGSQNWSADGWMAIAKSFAELGRGDAALQSWRKAIEKDPENYELRNQFARWLEDDERNAEAEEQLQLLLTNRDSNDVKHRLAAVRHAMKLKAIIEGR